MNNVSYYILQTLTKNGIIQKNDVDICKYGLEVFSISVLEILSILVVSVFLDNFLNTLMFFLAFVPFRLYAGGYHADSKIRCYLILLVVYGIFVFLTKDNFIKSITVLEYCSIIFTFMMVLFKSPIVSIKKKANVEEKKYYRKKSIQIMLVQCCIILTGNFLFPDAMLIFSFSLGQLAVTLSMVAAILKNKVIGGESDEKNQRIS